MISDALNPARMVAAADDHERKGADPWLQDLVRAGGDTERIVVPRERIVDLRTLWPLLQRELRDSLRNKWFVLYTLSFGGLAFALAYLSNIGTGLSGMAGFGKTAASLVNLTLLVVPLMALTMGAVSLSTERDRGMLGYLLAQPVSRIEVYLAKFLGQGLAFTGAIALGFGISAAALARHGLGDGALFLRLAGLSVLLALSLLALGMLIATVARRSTSAMGFAVFAWLAVTLLGDLGLLGATSFLDLEVKDMLALSLLNPTQVFKLGSIVGFDATLDLLGPAGLYAVRTLGSWLSPVLVGALVLWILVPLTLGALIFARRPL